MYNIRSDNDKATEQYRKLFIGGLSFATEEGDLQKYFEKYGELVDVVVMRVGGRAGKSRGFGFVTFKEAEMLEACQADRPHQLGERTLETKRAMPRDESNTAEAHMTTKKLFVGSLKKEVVADDLRDYFSSYGNIEGCEVITWKETGTSRGFGFVTFDDYDSVDKVLLHKPHEIDGIRCEVKKALTKEESRALKERQDSLRAAVEGRGYPESVRGYPDSGRGYYGGVGGYEDGARGYEGRGYEGASVRGYEGGGGARGYEGGGARGYEGGGARGYEGGGAREYEGGGARGYEGGGARGYEGGGSRGYEGGGARAYDGGARGYEGGGARAYDGGARGYEGGGARGYEGGVARGYEGGGPRVYEGGGARGYEGGTVGRLIQPSNNGDMMSFMGDMKNHENSRYDSNPRDFENRFGGYADQGYSGGPVRGGMSYRSQPYNSNSKMKREF